MCLEYIEVVLLMLVNIDLICWLIFWIFIRLGLLILILIGVLIFVVSMLIWVFIGIIYVLVKFGKLIIVLNFLIRFCVVIFFCYCFLGFNWINVLIMVSGVGFVVVFVCFILLNIVFIFGMVFINLLVCWRSFCVFLIDMLV